MANKRNTNKADKTNKNKSENNNINTNLNSPANDNAGLFDENNSLEYNELLFKEIQDTMAAGSYRDKVNEQMEELKDDGADAQVYSLQNLDKSSAKKKKKLKQKFKGLNKDAEQPSNQDVELTTNKQKKKKSYEKTTFAHKMKVLGILLILGIFTGSGLGVWYFNVTLKSNTDYSSLNASDYAGDVNEVLLRNFALSTESERKSWLNVAQAQSITPYDLSPVDNFLLAEYNASLASSYTAIGVGRVDTIASQTVYSAKKFDGTRYTFESISKGILSVGTCDTFVKGSNSIDIYNGNNIRNDGADWVYDSTITSAEYLKLCGNMPSAVQPYLISEKTVISSTEIVYNDETGNYSFTLELDPVKSVLLYYRQVKRSGGLEADPEFYSISQTITIDSNWNLVSLEVKEDYKAVKFSMGNKCTGTLKTDFSFNLESVTLPV